MVVILKIHVIFNMILIMGIPIALKWMTTRPHWWYAYYKIDSGNNLAPNRWQTITGNWLAWCIDLMWPIYTKWLHRTGSTLAQVMACCLIALSHYLNNIDFSSKVFCGIHLRAIWQEVLLNLRPGTPVLGVIFNKYLIFEFSTGNSFLLLGL